MKHIVSYSGGMGSFSEAKMCVDRYGKENTVLVFADTKMEDIDLYRFLKETVDFLGCELITLKDGRDVWELFEDEKFVGNSRVDVCSKVLKRELINKYIMQKYGYKSKKLTGKRTPTGRQQYKSVWLPQQEVQIHLGIDATEEHRLQRVQERMKPWQYRSILVEEGRIVYKDYSEQFGIERPRLYTLGFSHNNCGGFCVKAGLGHFKILWEVLPERYLEHERKEQNLKEKYGTLPFLSKQINGKRTYLYMKEYREQFLQEGKAEEDNYDIGGCACALPV